MWPDIPFRFLNVLLKLGFHSEELRTESELDDATCTSETHLDILYPGSKRSASGLQPISNQYSRDCEASFRGLMSTFRMRERESGGQLPIEKKSKKKCMIIHETQNISTVFPAQAPRAVGQFIVLIVLQYARLAWAGSWCAARRS